MTGRQRNKVADSLAIDDFGGLVVSMLANPAEAFGFLQA